MTLKKENLAYFDGVLLQQVLHGAGANRSPEINDELTKKALNYLISVLPSVVLCTARSVSSQDCVRPLDYGEVPAAALLDAGGGADVVVAGGGGQPLAGRKVHVADPSVGGF